MLWTPKKFLFLLLFLLAKGEKEDIISGYRTRLLKKKRLSLVVGATVFFVLVFRY